MPPESILLPITTHLPHFLNKRMPKLQARDSGIWWGTLNKLQLMLRKASQVGGVHHLAQISVLYLARPCMPTETSVLTRCTTTGWPSLRERWKGGRGVGRGRLDKYFCSPPGDQWLSECEQCEGPCHHLHQAMIIQYK